MSMAASLPFDGVDDGRSLYVSRSAGATRLGMALLGLFVFINDAVFRYGAFITASIVFVTTAAAIFLFVVKPMEALKARTQEPGDGVVSDEERRHQELLAALRGSSR